MAFNAGDVPILVSPGRQLLHLKSVQVFSGLVVPVVVVLVEVVRVDPYLSNSLMYLARPCLSELRSSLVLVEVVLVGTVLVEKGTG